MITVSENAQIGKPSIAWLVSCATSSSHELPAGVDTGFCQTEMRKM